jgi:P-type Cu2+ transporter
MPRRHKDTKENSDLATCSQCGLPFAAGGVKRNVGGHAFHFCCYGCSFTNSLTGETGESGTATMFLLRLGFSAFLSMNVMLFSWIIYADQWHGFGIEEEALPYIGMLLFVLSTPVILLVGYPFLRNGVRELLSRHLSMDSLIAIGSLAAYGYSTYEIFTGGDDVYFDTATMIIVLVTAGRYLEATAKVRSTQAIKKLLDLVPDAVRVVEDSSEVVKFAREVTVGSIIRVLPGEYIPLDGVITEGSTSVQEAFLTGESNPRACFVNDEIFAGTINIDGVVSIRTTVISEETVHAKIVHLMEEAQHTRSPIQKMVDRIAGIFIPVVILISLTTFLVWSFVGPVDRALMYALAVLVVACPCALGIGSPVAAAVSIGRAAAHGILVKSAGAMERAAKTRIAVLDKTGTLTRGIFSVSYIHALHNKDKFAGIVASVERGSGHPLATGIQVYVQETKAVLFPSRNITVIPGMGVKGEVEYNGRWKDVLIGSKRFLAANNIPITDSTEGDDNPPVATLVYGAWDGRLQGWIALIDTVRSNAKDMIRELHDLSVRTILISGDREEIVQMTAADLGIVEAYGQRLPADKIEFIKDLKQTTGGIMMVGDGINDAPSLAAADTGVTLSEATDIAKESADITILGSQLGKIPWLIRLSRKTRSTISWNLLWAFGYNVIAIVFAAFGYLQPILAAFAMIISSFMVIGNSMRLKGMKI